MLGAGDIGKMVDHVKTELTLAYKSWS